MSQTPLTESLHKPKYPRPNIQGNKHYKWAGDSIGYGGIHLWVKKTLGRPSLCSHCGTTEAKKFEWANVSKEYKRDIKDWIRLCVSCHRRYDGHGFTMWDTRGRTSQTVKCLKCHRPFLTYLCKLKIGKGKYCSRNCSNTRRKTI